MKKETKKYANLNELAMETAVSIVQKLPVDKNNEAYIRDFAACIMLATELFQINYIDWQGQVKRPVKKPREMSKALREAKADQAWREVMGLNEEYETNIFDATVKDRDSDNWKIYEAIFWEKDGKEIQKQMTDAVVKGFKLELVRK